MCCITSFFLSVSVASVISVVEVPIPLPANVNKEGIGISTTEITETTETEGTGRIYNNPVYQEVMQQPRGGMKFIVILLLLLIQGFCETKDNKCLNCQDVPTFFDVNPLKNLSSFAVVLPEANPTMQAVIEKELSSIGSVIKAASGDMTGLGSGTLLLIQIGPLFEWNGSPLPIFRVTLSVGASVTINRTHLQSHPRIWEINGFCKTSLDTTEVVQKLLQDFTETYQGVNAHQKTKPLFYLYTNS